MLDFCLLIACGEGQVFLNYVIKVIKQGYFKKHGLCKVRLPWEFLTVVQSQGDYLGKSCLTCAFAFLHCLIKHTPTLTPPVGRWDGGGSRNFPPQRGEEALRGGGNACHQE